MTSPIKIGDRAELRRTISDDDIRAFARITGDANPVHLDDAFAASTRFGRRIAHGMLGGGLISAVLATKLPGPGSIYLSQSLEFRAPVYPGDSITAHAEVVAVRLDKPVVSLRTWCVNDAGVIVLEGEAVLLVPC
jgi:3-hydroxybutyryl-CoA dehydratase